MSRPSPESCAACPAHNVANLTRLGIEMEDWDFVVALAGNPNTGKSTVFNALTGLRQHTGNWPGKTVSRAEGGFASGDQRYKLVDLPGTYSLLSSSYDEEIARDFILFGQPDVTVIVVDANRLERNLNLVLQILEITDRAVLCLNLMDEAERHGVSVDARSLSRDLGIPVVPTTARSKVGLDKLLDAIVEVASGRFVCKPHRIASRKSRAARAIAALAVKVRALFPELPNADWVAMRLLDGDRGIGGAVRDGSLMQLVPGKDSDSATGLETPDTDALFSMTSELRWQVGRHFHQAIVESTYAEAGRIADRAVNRSGEKPRATFDRTLDRLVTSRIFGVPLMLAMLTAVFWLTVAGANVPSAMLATLLVENGHGWLKELSASVGLVWWLDGLLIDGIYLSTAWVVSVMLPPMAIFFPLFTLLEDFGYLPRVAFNLDNIFRRSGAHGKQALTMAMGYGCNAAGVVATRIIESPRERLIAIITNNFSLCNGRWPTQILIATIFIGTLVPSALTGLVTALSVVAVALFGIFLTFVVSWMLSRTVLRGEVSTFSLELPPYRPPRILQTLYTSLIDRTIIVLTRAVVFALPAGALTWALANIPYGQISLAEALIGWLDPFGMLLGLSGVIMLAYIIAIPANEIVIPTILMLTVLSARIAGTGEGAGVMFELDSAVDTGTLLRAGGWTLLTAVNLMLFSLLHNPCSTTIFTIWKETRSWKWTALASLLPVAMGITLCFFVAQIWRLVAA